MCPWMRLDDSAPTNIKIQKLSDSAFRLWIKGLCYCQQHLTDGLIPTEALGPMEAKRKDIDQLCAALAPGKASLWEVHEHGYIVHDYFDWNDSKDEVIAKRDAAKARAKKHRTNSERNALPNANVQSGVGRGSSSFVSSEGVQGKPKPSYDIAPDLAARAGRFVERFEELFQTHRHGARYFRRQPALDFERALSLCGTWDDARLEKLVVVFMKSDDEWIEKTDRGMAAFAAKATWCDERLAAWEADQKRQGRAS